MGVATDGYPSLEEIKQANGWPSEERFAKGPVAIIECVQEIPCNPCEGACRAKAVQLGNPITNLPRVDFDKCNGCRMCVPACSGLAIFVVDKSYGETEATVSFPYEFVPLPEKGDVVNGLNRAGEYICKATVAQVLNPKAFDHTAVVTLIIPKEHADEVRTMQRLNVSSYISHFKPVPGYSRIEDDTIVCRCEEITAGQIRKAIKEHAGESVTGLKRRVRCGMGLCQGKTCGSLVTRLISEETGKKTVELVPSVDRPPVRPVTFGELIGTGEGGGQSE